MRASFFSFPAVLLIACVGDSSVPGPDASTDASADASFDAPAVDAADATTTEAGGPTTVASTAIYRGILTDSATYADHLYTATESELGIMGYTEDKPSPYFYFAKDAGPGGILKEIFRCSDASSTPPRHWLDFGNCGGYHVDGGLGFVATDATVAARCGGTQFRFLYRQAVGDRVFTYQQAEITNLESGGYVEQTGFVAYAWPAPTITCYP